MKTVCIFLFALMLCGPLAAADRELFRDGFAGASAWSASGQATTTVTQANGKLRYANSAAGAGAEITRAIRVPAAAAYRLSFRVVELSHEGGDSYYGVALRAPDGDQVGFVLAPEGQARINYWHDEDWAPSVLGWTQAPSMKRGAGAVNEVTIERQAGRFYLSVNGVLVGASDVVDFMPAQLVLVAKDPVVVEFDDISVVQTGLDSRMARLLLLAPVPGQAVLQQDDFNRTLKEKVRAKSLKKDDKWIVGNNGERDIGIDYERGLYTLEKKTDGDYWVYAGDVTEPQPVSGYSVGAKVAYSKVSPDGCGGVVVMGKPDKDKIEPMLVACYRPGANTAQLWYHPRDNSAWQALVDVPTAALVEGMNEVRLVLNDGKVLLFLNGEYQGDAPLPYGFEFYGVGFYVDARVGIEADDFVAREI